MECYICLSSCRIPIQLKNFECYRGDNIISCQTYKRICLQCYLDKQTHILQKCSFCHKEKKNENVSIDYNYIKNDEYSLLDCPFCDHFKGSHIDLFSHVYKEHIQICEKCNKISYKSMKDCVNEKVKLCGCDVIYKCQYCFKNFKKGKIMKHYLNHIDEAEEKISLLTKIMKDEKKKYQLILDNVKKIYKEIYNDEYSNLNQLNI